jgi:hypothetical protein
MDQERQEGVADPAGLLAADYIRSIPFCTPPKRNLGSHSAKHVRQPWTVKPLLQQVRSIESVWSLHYGSATHIIFKDRTLRVHLATVLRTRLNRPLQNCCAVGCFGIWSR